MLKSSIGYIKARVPLKSETSNTAMIHHAKRTFALVETDLPFHVKVEESEKNFDIKSIGYDNFEGQLNHNVSAHPKVDARTGDLYAFGYNFEKPILHFSVFDKNRHCNLKNQKIKITSPRMIHDFCITENHIIFPDLPMEVNGEKAVRNNKFIFQFDKT